MENDNDTENVNVDNNDVSNVESDSPDIDVNISVEPDSESTDDDSADNSDTVVIVEPPVNETTTDTALDHESRLTALEIRVGDMESRILSNEIRTDDVATDVGIVGEVVAAQQDEIESTDETVEDMDDAVTESVAAEIDEPLPGDDEKDEVPETARKHWFYRTLSEWKNGK